jgi:hypothetical protein
MRPGDVRIDRQTKWGNPFPMHAESERADVVEKYRLHLRDQLAAEETHGIADTLAGLAELHGKRLFCWCAPKACHGDVLARAAKWAVEAWPAKQAEWEMARREAENMQATMDALDALAG